MRKAIGKFFSQLREQADYYDYNLLAVVILLTCFGLVMLYSTSAYEAEIRFGDDMHYFARQAGISLAAVLIAVIISKSNDKWVYCRHQERTILKLKPMECYTALKFQNLNTICTRKSLK